MNNITEISSYPDDPRQLKIFRAGQQGYLLESGGVQIGIDLYLTPSPKRLIPNFFEAEDLSSLSLLLGTHNHLDHIDKMAWARIAATCPMVKFVAPAYFEDKLPQELAIDKNRFLFVDENQPVEFQGIHIRAVAAAHEFLVKDAVTGYHPYLCYVVDFNGYKLFHAGDTCRYDGFAGKISESGAPDVAFLPINGRDAKRYASGCIGNMTYQEAADLAGDIRPTVTIPGHYDMFAHNSEDPELFRTYMEVKYPSLKCVAMPAGTSFVYGR